jgi:hypothetical protein
MIHFSNFIRLHLCALTPVQDFICLAQEPDAVVFDFIMLAKTFDEAISKLHQRNGTKQT